MNLYDFDRAVNVGDEVEARWTNNHSAYRARGTVEKVNKMTLRVRITDADNYLHGRSAVIERVGSQSWSDNNCVAPVAR